MRIPDEMVGRGDGVSCSFSGAISLKGRFLQEALGGTSTQLLAKK
jgi:hypothetical protein